MKRVKTEAGKLTKMVLGGLSKVAFSSSEFGAGLASRAGKYQPKAPEKLRRSST